MSEVPPIAISRRLPAARRGTARESAGRPPGPLVDLASPRARPYSDQSGSSIAVSTTPNFVKGSQLMRHGPRLRWRPDPGGVVVAFLQGAASGTTTGSAVGMLKVFATMRAFTPAIASSL